MVILKFKIAIYLLILYIDEKFDNITIIVYIEEFEYWKWDGIIFLKNEIRY